MEPLVEVVVGPWLASWGANIGANWWGEGLYPASDPIRCPVQQTPFPEARSRSGRTPWHSTS